MSAYLHPRDMTEALAALAQGGRALAGGTDLYPATQASEPSGALIDLTALDAMRGITLGPDGLRIAACTTWADILRADLPPALTALAQAARQVGGVQIHTSGTIGGNLCNASPAADGVPPLLACDALVELASARGPRRLPLGAFVTGPRRTALAADEVLTAVIVPPAGLTGASVFIKLGARAHLVISIAMVAVRLNASGGRITSAAMAVGACAPTARRLPMVEAALTGTPLEGAAARIDPAMVAAALSPIDDPRASAAYRSHAACELLRRAVGDLGGGQG